MDDKTSQLLEKLAAKLGTTTEYLWSVLLKQAPISAAQDIILVIITVVFALILIRIHKRLSKPESNDRYAENAYEKYELGAALPMITGLLIVVILIFCSITSISNIINGFINPEYWALSHILDKL